MIDVILPHEQADFDAIGAALGAYLMNEKAYPVAPRRLNRNVKAFLTLYGAELPFIEARDLPNETIETITLVDTQAMITLKGKTHKTRVLVVDHHPLRPDLPPDWHVTIDQVGACTTLFVEGLHEHNGVLSPIHATLLLLGIHEDTGSLTYAHTTPRDIRAAAYLVEQGASLQILSRYLNPPLSVEQRAVYDRLISSALRIPLHGLQILVAGVVAEELNDEISTIAHKMRDLLEPDALFLLVQTGEGIRLVARSVTDQVDVSEISGHFGGGGHERAAAALIKQAEQVGPADLKEKKPALEEILTELTRILPEHVRPSSVVRQIMSPRPLVLAPDTPAEKALHLMQRYGYEGYPIIEQGKVVGLLTRRAVDRATSHKLNLPASSLMDAGEVTVHPQDSLEHLRRVMIDSGWGQVPVIDPETQKIVGIVTRTDLLKSSQTGPHGAGKQNLATRLEGTLPPARLAFIKAVASKALEHHLAIYIVGGFVRDLILERPSLDFDVVVEGDAISLARSLAEDFGGKVLSHQRFGTAKWMLNEIRAGLVTRLATAGPLDPADLPESLDLISARTEFYDYPTALPTVERSNIKLDLHRRDFTINTLALRLDGRHYGDLYDYWGGLRDLRRGLIRVLHSLSFVDDPTRLMRAIRFEQRFGFEIEERTHHLMSEARLLVKQVSGDRLRHEIDLVLSELHPQPMLSRLDELGLLEAIYPGFNWPTHLNPIIEKSLHAEIDPHWSLGEKTGNLATRLAVSYLVWLVQYSPDHGIEISRRLRLSNDLQDNLKALHRLKEDLPSLVNAPPGQITFRMDETPSLALYTLSVLESNPLYQNIIQTYIKHWRNIWPVTNGNTLLQMNVPTGPHYHTILTTLRAGRLDGTINTDEEEKERLHELLIQFPAPGTKGLNGA